MPYLPENLKSRLLKAMTPETEGELNFCITKLCQRYLMSLDRDARYADLNAVVGALECAKQEFVRRVVNGYEDKQIAKNGDVYEVEETDIYRNKP